MHRAIELLTRILCDTRPGGSANGTIDGAYLYCTTMDNQDSVFRAAVTIIRLAVASRIFILETEAMSGYPGVSQCRKGLEKIGLKAEQIMGVPLKRATSINTLIESQALIQFARELKLRTLVVVSPPFHQLRAFMTAVTVALKLYPELAIYSYAGAAMPWMAPVTHSQGTLQAERRHLIQEELIRIDTYQKKGDLGPFETVLDYLNRRDDKPGVQQ